MTFTDRPTAQQLLLRASTAWRMRRTHRPCTTRVLQIRCAACRRWRHPRRYRPTSAICRDCGKGRTAYPAQPAATSG
jgi:hypothetical protein